MSTLTHIPLLNTLDRSVGELMAKKANDKPVLIESAAALTSYALRQGHVCLETSTLKNSEFVQYFDNGYFDDFPTNLKSHDLVGTEFKDTNPLILTNGGKLYFHRYWHYEKGLLANLRNRICKKASDSISSNSFQLLHDLTEIGEQQKTAVQVSNDFPLTLISGGPGTGKTTTVVYILAHLVQSEREQPIKIGLAAPTGKAAQRIKMSLESGLSSISLNASTKELIPTDAVTLHRLLGYIRNSSKFRHNKEAPLPYDVVIVDEASMLDLLMFSKLLNALHPETKLILLGDRHQLASVEAGSIFGDLVQASQTNSLLKTHTVELTQNYRFGNESVLFQVCELIKDGKASEALSKVQNAGEAIHLQNLPPVQKMTQVLETLLAPHFLDIARAENAQAALTKLEGLCLLTPILRGGYGVEGLNATVEMILRRKLNISNQTRHFSGQPILITQNSYSQNLFNGDLGVLFRSTNDEGELFAYFKDDNERNLRRLPLSALPGYEFAYALTVHKSQGSEYKRVVFVIPPTETPIVTRELIYTAISRSRHRVEILSQPTSFLEGVRQQTRRASGILDGMNSPSLDQ